MKEGDQVCVLEFREPARIALPDCRFFVAAALACGYRLAGKYPVQDFLDAEGGDLEAFNARLQSDSASVSRVVRIAFDASVKAAFCPPGGFEQIGIVEFRRRWEDEAWRKANPEHPLAYQFALVNWMKQLAQSLKNSQTIRLSKGEREAYILINPTNDPKIAADNAQFLEWFKNGLPEKKS